MFKIEHKITTFFWIVQEISAFFYIFLFFLSANLVNKWSEKFVYMKNLLYFCSRFLKFIPHYKKKTSETVLSI